MSERAPSPDPPPGASESRGQVSTVVLVVRPGANPRRAAELRRWIRALVPAALILVSSVPVDLGASDDVVTVSADELDAGPLAVAAALARPRHGGS